MSRQRNKLIQLIADSMCKVYGNTLKENGTDVAMAEAVYTRFIRNQYRCSGISKSQYEKWKLRRRQRS